MLEPSLTVIDSEILNQVKRLFTTTNTPARPTTKINESDNIFLRVPEMTVAIVEKYEEEEINQHTGLPATQRTQLQDPVSHMKINSKLHFLKFYNEKLLTNKHQWWIPEEQYQIILWIIWNAHITNDMHYGIQETIKQIKKSV